MAGSENGDDVEVKTVAGGEQADVVEQTHEGAGAGEGDRGDRDVEQQVKTKRKKEKSKKKKKKKKKAEDAADGDTDQQQLLRGVAYDVHRVAVKRPPMTKKEEEELVLAPIAKEKAKGQQKKRRSRTKIDIDAVRTSMLEDQPVAAERSIDFFEWRREKFGRSADSFFALLCTFVKELNEKKSGKHKQGATVAAIHRTLRTWQEHYLSWTCEWRKAQNDWTRLIKPALLYLSCTPLSPRLEYPIKGMRPFVTAPKTEGGAWVWATFPSADKPGLLSILTQHFLTNLHHTRMWTSSLPITGDPVRPYPSARSLERVSAARKQLDKYRVKGGTVEERCAKVVQRVKRLNHLRPCMCTPEEVASIRAQEVERFAQPHRPFRYKISCAGVKYEVVVPPLRGFEQADPIKARGPFLLAKNRPSMASLHWLVIDAVARLPSAVGSLDDICDSLVHSQYIKPHEGANFEGKLEASVHKVLHDEQDGDMPAVAYWFRGRQWVYLLRGEPEAFFLVGRKLPPPKPSPTSSSAKANTKAPAAASGASSSSSSSKKKGSAFTITRGIPNISVTVGPDNKAKRTKTLNAEERSSLEASYKALWKSFGLNQELTKMSAAKYISLIVSDLDEMEKQVKLAVATGRKKKHGVSHGPKSTAAAAVATTTTTTTATTTTTTTTTTTAAPDTGQGQETAAAGDQKKAGVSKDDGEGAPVPASTAGSSQEGSVEEPPAKKAKHASTQDQRQQQQQQQEDEEEEEKEKGPLHQQEKAPSCILGDEATQKEVHETVAAQSAGAENQAAPADGHDDDDKDEDDAGVPSSQESGPTLGDTSGSGNAADSNRGAAKEIDTEAA